MCSQFESSQPADYTELVSTAMASRVSVHAVSWVPNRALESFSKSTQGSFQVVSSDQGMVGAIEQVCLSLLARYSVLYQAAAEGRSLRTLVYTPQGWGDALVPAVSA